MNLLMPFTATGTRRLVTLNILSVPYLLEWRQQRIQEQWKVGI